MALLVDRIGKNAVGFGNSSQHIVEMQRQLGMVAQDLVVPQLIRHNHPSACRILSLTGHIGCHHGSVSDIAYWRLVMTAFRAGRCRRRKRSVREESEICAFLYAVVPVLVEVWCRLSTGTGTGRQVSTFGGAG